MINKEVSKAFNVLERKAISKAQVYDIKTETTSAYLKMIY